MRISHYQHSKNRKREKKTFSSESSSKSVDALQHTCARISVQGCQMVLFFKPIIQIWVIFGGSCNGRCWYILQSFGIFYGHWVYFVVIWYNFPVLVCCDEKNLATLYPSHRNQRTRRIIPTFMNAGRSNWLKNRGVSSS
jgi:hypothetical protein